MFLSFYNLREQPFGVTPNPRYLCATASHREALASLQYSIDSGVGFATLIASPGMGKTTLLFDLLGKYQGQCRSAFIFHTQDTSPSLIRLILHDLHVPTPSNDPIALLDALHELLLSEARAQKRVLVFIDEAQNLTDQGLETVRMLSNFETSEAKLLHVILAGQPQLGSRLRQPNLAQLAQRVAINARLSPLSRDEVSSYVDHRLRVAGHSRNIPLFTTAALSAIAEHSQGIPRKINRICFNALSLGCALRANTIEEAHIGEVVRDLSFSSRDSEPEPSPRISAAQSNENKEATPANRPTHLRVCIPAAAPAAPHLIPSMQSTTASVTSSAAPRRDPAPVSTTVASPVAFGASASKPRPSEHLNQESRGAVTPSPVIGPKRVQAPPTKIVRAARKEQLWSRGSVRIISFLVGVIGCGLLTGFTWWWRGNNYSIPSPLHAPAVVAAEMTQVDAAQTEPTREEKPATPPAARKSAPENRSNFSPVKSSQTNNSMRDASDDEPEVTVRTVTARTAADSAPARMPAAQPLSEPQPRRDANTSGRAGADRERTADDPALPSTARTQTAVTSAMPRSSAELPATTAAIPAFASPVQLVQWTEPAFPDVAKRHGIEGTVILKVMVGTDGSVQRYEVLSGNPVLAQAAVNAVRSWRYRPASLNGNPVEAETAIVVRFSLPEGR